MSNLPTFISEIMTHTPIWVWAVFALVTYLGWQRTRDRVVSLWRLLLFPAVIIVIAATGLAHASLGTTLPTMLIALAIGGTAGWLLEREGATRRLPDGKLWVRGEWWSLAQVLAIFGFRYATIAAATVNPGLGAEPVWQIVTTLVSSTLSAMVLGRTLARLRVYLAGPVEAPAA